MGANKLPDHEYLKSQIDYDPETGDFFWKVRRKGRFPGRKVGSLQPNGYLLITIDGVRYFAHRLAWLYMTGKDPEGNIDHRDGVRTNNRFANLRDGDQQCNTQNLRKARSDNSSGFLGVATHAYGFTAQIHHEGKKKHLGLFKTPEEAHAVYVRAKREIHAGCTL
jgi:hypothetical protein